MERESGRKRSIVLLRVILTVLATAYACWIFSNSLKTAAQSTVASNRVQRLVQGVCDAIFGDGKVFVSSLFIRKTAHFCEFALLGFLVFFTVYVYVFRKKQALFYCLFVAAGSALLVGAIDEILQIFTEGRGPSPWDTLLDFSGGVAGDFFALIIYFLVRAIFRKVCASDEKEKEKSDCGDESDTL